jgi:hypothetical protein
MFPGSLQLGGWRLRAVSSGQTVLEWFSSEFNAWRQVTSFTQNETTELQTERLRADTLLIGTDGPGIEGIAAVIDGKLRALDNLETTGRLRADTVAPFFQGAVRVEGGLDVAEGALTVGGVNVANALAASEPAFTAVAPLQKGFNIQTGKLELRVNTADLGGNPFFCAARVNGQTLAAGASLGSVGYTVLRPAGFSAGVYEIRFDSAAPHNDYVVSLTQQGAGSVTLWNAADRQPTTNGFYVVCYNTSNGVADFVFHFSVVV